MTMPGDVVIVGGGFAGCAAALHMARMGVRPILIEYKFSLGGRTTSYTLKDWPAPLDNGQHVILGCCDRTRRFLEDVGAADAVEWHRTLPVSAPGEFCSLTTWPVFAPFHLIPFLARFPQLTATERARVAWGIFRMATSDADGLWTDTAARFGQTDLIQERFWNPFLVSALNADPAKVSTSHVRHLVHEAFLRTSGGMKIGIPISPLLTLFNERIRPELERRGVVLKMGKRVLRFSLNGPEGFVVHLHDQSALLAQKIILATCPAAAKIILEETTGVEQTAKSITPVLGGSPIISIHLLYDRILTRLAFCQVFGRMIQWIFNKGVYDGRQHIQAVISAADSESEQSKMELVISADAEVRDALGVQADLLRGTAFIEKNATFTPQPGIVRPRVNSSSHPHLFLAGDYVDTGWPATIESAVRSGHMAAEAALYNMERRTPPATPLKGGT